MEIVSFVQDSFQEYEGEHSLVLFSKGCIYNCYHCHNKDEINASPIGEAMNIISKEVTPMHTAVVLLGGEPCLHSDIKDICSHIKSIGLKVKLYTNGHFVKIIQNLIDNKLLDAISIDFKCTRNTPEILGINISGAFYRRLVRDSIKISLESGIDTEVRTTIFDISPPKEEIRDYISVRFPGIRHIFQTDNLLHGKRNI